MITPPKLRSQYTETMVHLMIAYGGVMHVPKHKYEHGRPEPVGYYSSNVNCSGDKTREAIEDFKSNGINYPECSDPASHHASCFAGTFTSNQYRMEYLQSIIVSNSGKIYTFLLSLNEIKFGSLVNYIAKYDLEFEWAIDKIEQKITAFYDKSYNKSDDFGSLCYMGSLSLQ